MKYILLIFTFALMITACKKKKEPCTATAGTTVAPASEEDSVKAYLTANGITNAVELGNSGLYYVIDAAGSSERAELCAAVIVKYVGKLKDGKVFDQTTGTSTATFGLSDFLIEGWKRTMTLIGEGGKIRLFIPPALGYGANPLIDPRTGVTVIPANSILIFDVDMVAITNY
ncbi:MAG: FKBP-type peptidyl-prolyl cis-trans isomerase [Chitinophagaceae bacterium]|jgi:FKBP-type peptidyl-prolyl cis-trans isomerase FkpA|nr:FKBP-type peptidyl-prolyl cis-trans isomerase [Chitinophagaceae bacterium]